ncbi:mitochondrial carnitine/acylcarnitine carrierlike protein [Acanthamoeba castellanii str. Neff]|uniref:Mitochondrial carnitine/acylcarnitine carrierlike protein n=1 Tax=Acanthamoeba castellanii (strain ATCC 30010 / Neff) TaxID=1257118 RepID=L8GF19_ACACF|nr:mitochondrial carnitine/acylcarnitine carrierlike protein [Acanthamoeba castellanii str. Neff]ELR11660.1 mitochondrial carnitine/acylcarnitine carrierlike protein [Acanthamoeba castellanii str. Neff]
MSSRRERSTEALKDIAAGSVRGFAQVVVGHPLDTIKVRLQTQGGERSFNGLLDCFWKTLAKEGVLLLPALVRGLYKGAASPITGCAFYSATLFLSYGQAKALFDVENKPTVVRLMMAGFLTGSLCSFVEGPVDLIKCRLQAQHPHHLATTPACDLPSRGVVYQSSWDCAKKIVESESRDLSAGSVIAAGGMAGVVFWLSCYPMDLIKSRIQTDHPDPSQRRYRGVLDCVRQIHATEGYRGFWRGFSACLVRAFPVNAATFLAFETFRSLISI